MTGVPAASTTLLAGMVTCAVEPLTVAVTVPEPAPCVTPPTGCSRTLAVRVVLAAVDSTAKPSPKPVALTRTTVRSPAGALLIE